MSDSHDTQILTLGSYMRTTRKPVSARCLACDRIDTVRYYGRGPKIKSLSYVCERCEC